LLICFFADVRTPEFLVTSVNGTTTGRVASVGPGFALKLDKQVETPAGELVALRQIGVVPPERPREAMVLLANGDVVAGVVVGGQGEVVRFQPGLGSRTQGAWNLLVSTLAALWLESPGGELPREVLKYGWVTSAKQDSLLLKNRDVLRGTLEGFTSEPPSVRLKLAEKPTENLGLNKLSAIAFDPSLARVRKPKTTYAQVTLRDGSRVSVSQVEATDSTVTLTLLAGPKWSVPWKDVVALDVLQGKAVRLGDIKPKSVETTAFQGLSWPMVVDRNVHGEVIRLKTPFGVGAYEHGLGLHSKTKLVYDLGGNYRRLETLVGLDAKSGGKGAVDVTMTLDGKALALDELKNLTLARGAISLVIDTAGVKELTILVDYGPGGDVQDDVNFAEARLIE
jgi:NPCBM/NEW2 domain